MPQTWLDEDSHKILKSIQEQMKRDGHRGATLGDAVRQLMKDAGKTIPSPKEAAVVVAT